ncbi:MULTISPECIES: DUF4097 family beta strand repeat-containing protein [Bacillus]|jgi:DUF4097 and DUF4098 domain-containing protein YvlB|uniref:DUF4097 domain-containing protein n=1 Tax=Bacillus cereus VD048 TaxID=1053226 RepID=J8I7K7_BACCE|nr:MULTISPECIES: DUF4097 family beta strand repeat-containing protein [Bacillus]EJR35788.1 hypothetical protein IIG_01476 [Bacillus cereus VD048]MBK5428907.1 DUF4097 family beta strand repeat protein [Bacillus sp. TH30]QWH29596.1 hypothetical protein EXW51_17225 [Bacillus mycoides]WJE33024.1 DUF4097 family beta strand repeat-containing protein [Bacillus mycoides]WOA61722.1 DUF4097 family beta strand repeat-containing protein [Bacillus mycoides]
MINKKKLSIIAGIIFIIGIVGSLFTYRSIATVPISEEKVINNNNVSSVIIDTNNVRVNINPTTESNMKVTLDGEVNPNIKRTLATDEKDSTLLISYKEKQQSWFNFNISEVLVPLTLNVYLPEKQYDSLKISNNNGYVSAKQQNTTHFDINTSNGRVELREINSQKINAETNNGSMDFKDITAQNIHVKSNNGRIMLDHVEGELEGQSKNGSLSLKTNELDRNLNFTTHNGKINIETEKEPTNVQFNVSVDNGKANILNKYNGNTVIGKGENQIKLNTHNGSISVKKHGN